MPFRSQSIALLTAVRARQRVHGRCLVLSRVGARLRRLLGILPTHVASLGGPRGNLGVLLSALVDGGHGADELGSGGRLLFVAG